MTTAPSAPSHRPARWPWLALALACCWVACARVPLILNADSHLDSDLAVDGLTLIEAVHGHWRWHYPGTPHMGSPPVLLSLPQSLVFGVNSRTLASGGLVAYELVVVATFLLAWRAFGRFVACGALIPLAFASTGVIWLSGRVTGGHLFTLAWHTAAFWGFHACVLRPNFWRALALGLWCGLGLYLDQMFFMSVASIVSVSFGVWLIGGSAVRRLSTALVFMVGLTIGYVPHLVGARVDSYDSYSGQFDRVGSAAELFNHARILVLDCIPRLISGHRLPGMESEPPPAAVGAAPIRRGAESDALEWATVALTLPTFAASICALMRAAATSLADKTRAAEPTATAAVATAALLASAGAMVGFVINKNIFNSDNYRYLVLLLTPWALGFGVLLNWSAKRRPAGPAASALFVLAFAAVLTIDSARWYHRFGWVGDAGAPVRKRVSDPALEWLNGRRDVAGIFGGYWDVYRLSFLTGGRVKGVPYPVFPNRFPEWSDEFPGRRPRILLARPRDEGAFYQNQALSEGAKVLFRLRGLTVIDWP
jgi:hypothetical protein